MLVCVRTYVQAYVHVAVHVGLCVRACMSLYYTVQYLIAMVYIQTACLCITFVNQMCLSNKYYNYFQTVEYLRVQTKSTHFSK